MTKKDIKELLIKDGTVKISWWLSTKMYDLYYKDNKIWDCISGLIHEKADQDKIKKEVIKLYMKHLSKYCYSPFYDKEGE